MSKKTSGKTTKGTVRTLSRILSATLALMLVFTMAMPAFADDPWVVGDVDNPAEAVAAKVFVMPEFTTTPVAKFTFVFEKMSVNGVTDPAIVAKMPDIDEQYVEFLATDDGKTENGVKTVIKETGSFFATTPWEHTGEYIYNVTEDATAADNYDITDPFAEELIYSLAEYELQVIVKQDKDSGKYYVESVVATVITTDEGDPGSGKVDPTPGDTNIEGSYSDIRFKNMYLKNNGGTNPLTSSVLAIDHVTDGSMKDTNKLFSYTLTVSNPQTVVDPDAEYKASVIQEIAGVRTIIDITADMYAGTIYHDGDGKGDNFDYIMLKVDNAATIKLLDGQSLVFYDLPVGAGFVAELGGEPYYVPSYELTIDGDPAGVDAALAGESLSTPNNPPKNIGEKENKAEFASTYDTIPLTGIIVNNLPYISLIGIALVLLLGYTGLKIRRRSYEYNQ